MWYSLGTFEDMVSSKDLIFLTETHKSPKCALCIVIVYHWVQVWWIMSLPTCLLWLLPNFRPYYYSYALLSSPQHSIFVLSVKTALIWYITWPFSFSRGLFTLLRKWLLVTFYSQHFRIFFNCSHLWLLPNLPPSTQGYALLSSLRERNLHTEHMNCFLLAYH